MGRVPLSPVESRNDFTGLGLASGAVNCACSASEGGASVVGAVDGPVSLIPAATGSDAWFSSLAPIGARRYHDVSLRNPHRSRVGADCEKGDLRVRPGGVCVFRRAGDRTHIQRASLVIEIFRWKLAVSFKNCEHLDSPCPNSVDDPIASFDELSNASPGKLRHGPPHFGELRQRIATLNDPIDEPWGSVGIGPSDEILDLDQAHKRVL